ncbi:hypothetical protein Tco_0597903, partial [Tanacetum coccineum]
DLIKLFLAREERLSSQIAQKQGPETRFERTSPPRDFGAVYKDTAKYQTSLFEHFLIAGIHPNANLRHVEDAFALKKKWEAKSN